MSFALTCACGARLEIDAVFAGKTVPCPDCSLPLQVPVPRNPLLRTSGLALTSLVLALVGAFTLIGTLLAVIFGVVALVNLRGKEGWLEGKGFALAGILLGALFTGATIFALTSTDLFGMRRLLAEAQWAGKLQYNGTEEIQKVREGFAISPPSKAWGEYREAGQGGKNGLSDRAWDDLLLVNPGKDAHILCTAKLVDPTLPIENCREMAISEFRGTDKAGLFGRRGLKRTPQKFHEGKSERPAVQGSEEITETTLEKTLAGQDRIFLMRVIKKPGDNTAYILIAGTRAKNFPAMKDELVKGLNSFRLLQQGIGQ